MSPDNGGPAFPKNQWNGPDGITKRDYLAAHASEEDVKCAVETRGGLVDQCTPDERAQARYAFADAMLTERRKGEGKP